LLRRTGAPASTRRNQDFLECWSSGSLVRHVRSSKQGSGLNTTRPGSPGVLVVWISRTVCLLWQTGAPASAQCDHYLLEHWPPGSPRWQAHFGEEKRGSGHNPTQPASPGVWATWVSSPKGFLTTLGLWSWMSRNPGSVCSLFYLFE